MQDNVVQRTGLPPLRFKGTLINSADGELFGDTRNNRFYTIHIYKSDSGKFVVKICYETSWRGEEGHCTVLVCGRCEDITQKLSHINPLEHVVGFPDSPEYALRQQKLLNSLQAQWSAVLTEALDHELFMERL